MVAKKWVFAVHKYESSDGVRHDVAYGRGKNYKVRRFKKWTLAQKFAAQKAKDMGMTQYQIDTPRRPHVMIKLKPKKK